MSSDFRHDCSRQGCLQATLPSWDWMRGCFPRGIMPTDIDGMVEINGQILFIEQKRCGVSLSGGQSAAFKSLAKNPNVTVWFIRPTIDPQVFECLVKDGSSSTGWRRQNLAQMRAFLNAWSEAAEGRRSA